MTKITRPYDTNDQTFEATMRSYTLVSAVLLCSFFKIGRFSSVLGFFHFWRTREKNREVNYYFFYCLQRLIYSFIFHLNLFLIFRSIVCSQRLIDTIFSHIDQLLCLQCHRFEFPIPVWWMVWTLRYTRYSTTRLFQCVRRKILRKTYRPLWR